MLIKIIKHEAAVVEKQADEKTQTLLRKYNDYVFYDGGKYEETGLMQLHIYPNVKDISNMGPVTTLYYDNSFPAELNKAIERAKDWVNKLRRCRVCKCTEYNCSQCVKKTGQPCSWIEDDLCSACRDTTKQKVLPPPEEILKDLKNTQKEIAKGLDELEQMLSPQNENDMNFFTELMKIGKVDMTLRIMEKDGKLTINLMPGAGSVSITPMIITGTPEELNEGFFAKVMPDFQEVSGLVSNIDAVKKEAISKPKAKNKTTTKPEKAKNVVAKKPVIKKPAKHQEPAEAPLF